MKNNSSIILTLLLIAGINFNCNQNSYIHRMMKGYVHTSSYMIEHKINKDGQWYFKAVISAEDGNKLLQLHDFVTGFSSLNLKGKIPCLYITRKSNYFYYLDDSAVGRYRYVLLCLTADKKQVEIYDSVGD